MRLERVHEVKQGHLLRRRQACAHEALPALLLVVGVRVRVGGGGRRGNRPAGGEEKSAEEHRPRCENEKGEAPPERHFVILAGSSFIHS
jgi:hypothetical protein